MTPQNTVDLKGNFIAHPFAELLVEIAQAKLSGSLRISRGDKKTVVYIRDGEVVYAVSNARAFRLFTVLLGAGRINNEMLAKHPNIANDIEFAASLLRKGVFTQPEIDTAIVTQIKQIMIDALVWPEAEWVFSPLARLRDDLVYDADIYNVLVEYARCIPPNLIFQRFKSVNEVFSAFPDRAAVIHLQKHESDVLSMFGGNLMTVEQLKPLCNLPDAALFQALYALWLGGLILRQNWNAAFSPNKINHIRTAKMSLVKESIKPAVADPGAEPEAENTPPPVPEQPEVAPVIEMSLEEYLERVENAETHYDLMGIDNTAALTEIKAAYFAMAKLFHPDRYHRETGVLLRRIQVAFTDLAQAYETLKSAVLRKSYDLKMSRELEMREKRRAEGMPETESDEQLKSENGLESFELGLNLLMEEDYAAAATHLARAVHAGPQNALYHAYYGQALSFLNKFQHKAEAEMQAAARLDPKNPKIRLMLVQFFIGLNMLKRAEGELNRFLEIAPDNKEARDLLNSLKT